MYKIALVLSALPILALSCPSPTIHVEKPNTICSVDFIFNQGCEYYAFSQCEITSCISVGSTKHCSNYIQTNFNACMQTCCNSSPSGDQYQFAVNCARSDATASEATTVLLAIMITLGCLFVISLILCIAYFKCVKRNQINRESNDNPQSQNPQISSKASKNQLKRKNEITVQMLLEWKEGETEQIDYDCVICLGSNPNLKLECGHRFHPHCFFEWIKKKKQCGVCRGTKIAKSTLICRKCLKKHVEIDIGQLPLIKKYKARQLCQQCSGK